MDIMQDFERAKQTVGGRSIMMTSWFDENKQTWRASAPAYAHLSSVIEMAREDSASRHAAVSRLSSLLAAHFDKAVR
jgi:hypothetical protein